MDQEAGRTHELTFRELSLDTFWLLLHEKYPVTSEMAVRI
jgi:hypothetical protein